MCVLLSSSALPLLLSSSLPFSHQDVTPPPTTTAPILGSCRTVVLEAMSVDVERDGANCGLAWLGL